jgi:hypothetical protein
LRDRERKRDIERESERDIRERASERACHRREGRPRGGRGAGRWCSIDGERERERTHRDIIHGRKWVASKKEATHLTNFFFFQIFKYNIYYILKYWSGGARDNSRAPTYTNFGHVANSLKHIHIYIFYIFFYQ